MTLYHLANIIRLFAYASWAVVFGLIVAPPFVPPDAFYALLAAGGLLYLTRCPRCRRNVFYMKRSLLIEQANIDPWLRPSKTCSNCSLSFVETPARMLWRRVD